MLGAPRAARAWRSEQIHASTFVCSVRCQLLVARNPVGTGSARSARVCPRSPFGGERRNLVKRPMFKRNSPGYYPAA